MASGITAIGFVVNDKQQSNMANGPSANVPLPFGHPPINRLTVFDFDHHYLHDPGTAGTNTHCIDAMIVERVQNRWRSSLRSILVYFTRPSRLKTGFYWSASHSSNTIDHKACVYSRVNVCVCVCVYQFSHMIDAPHKTRRNVRNGWARAAGTTNMCKQTVAGTCLAYSRAHART